MRPLPRHRRSGRPAPHWSAANRRPGAAEAGGHLVVDEQHARLPAGAGQAGERGGGRHPHARRPLHQRLDHHRRQLVGVLVDDVDRHLEVGVVVEAGRPQDGEPQGVEDVGAEAAVAEGQGADGVAVVGPAEGEEPAALGAADVDPVLERDLEGLLHRRRPVAREQETGVVDRDDRGQGLGQLDHHPVAVAEHGRVGHPVELVADGLVELGDVVAEGVHPERRDGVEVPPPVDVDELVSLGPLDHDGLARQVLVHRREPVPHHGRITPGPVLGRVENGHRPMFALTGRRPRRAASVRRISRRTRRTRAAPARR